MARRLRRYQVFLVTRDRPAGKFVGYDEAWDLTAEDAVAKFSGGVARRIRGNTFETVDGDVMYAEMVR